MMFQKTRRVVNDVLERLSLEFLEEPEYEEPASILFESINITRNLICVAVAVLSVLFVYWLLA